MTVRYAYDAARRKLLLHLLQTRSGKGGVFTLPFSFAAVDAEGRDMPGSARTVRFDAPEMEVEIPDISAPAFLSINRDAGFYGTCMDRSATAGTLAQQVRLDRNAFNRVEALRRLTDIERRLLLADTSATVSDGWLDVYRCLFADTSVSDGIKGYLLKIDEQPLDRTLLPHVREGYRVRQRLLQAAARACGEQALLSALRPPSSVLPPLSSALCPPSSLPAAIERRFLKNAFLQLLVGLDTPDAHAALEEHLAQSVNITDRLNTLTAIWQSSHPARRAVLAREGEALRQTLGGYLGYLQVIGLSPREDVFEAIEEEARRPSFSLSHPGLSRSLYVPLSLNNAQLWTARGLRVMTDTVIRLAPVSEFTTLRLIAPFQAYPGFASDLRVAVASALREMLAGVREKQCPSVTGRLEAYLT